MKISSEGYSLILPLDVLYSDFLYLWTLGNNFYKYFDNHENKNLLVAAVKIDKKRRLENSNIAESAVLVFR